MDFWFKVVFIMTIESAIITSFLIGLEIGGKFRSKDKDEVHTPKEWTELPDDILDPVSPADQRLDRKLEEEARSNVRNDEEDED